MIEKLEKRIEKYNQEIEKGTKIVNTMIAKRKELLSQISQAQLQLVGINSRKAEAMELLAGERKPTETKDESE